MNLSLLGDIAGFLGAATILSGFAYQTLRDARPDILSNLLNLIGATLLGISLTIHYNLAALCLEVAWAGVAIYGLARLAMARR